MNDGFVRESNGHLFLVLPIRVEGPTGISNVYEAIVDTGFTGQLALPASQCLALGLQHVRTANTMFGNASFEEIAVYRANVFWYGNWRNVSVLATGADVLIGMNMLRGSSVRFDAADMGMFMIDPIDPDFE